MTPDETVMLARYVRALCPQQKFDEYTPDAWHDVLGDYTLLECRSAAAEMARRQPFISPAEIIDVIRQRRGDNARDIQGPGQPAAIPDADPDDIPAYLAAIRQQRIRAADGHDLKPRDMKALLRGVGQTVPDEEKPAQGPLGVACPHCHAEPLRGCRSHSGKRLSLFHPSRIDVAHGHPATDPAVEIARRKAASAAALSTHAENEIVEETP